jgi:hypothetical protein
VLVFFIPWHRAAAATTKWCVGFLHSTAPPPQPNVLVCRAVEVGHGPIYYTTVLDLRGAIEEGIRQLDDPPPECPY